MIPGCVLGIDTSCYTTSCALAALHGQVLTSVRLPLAVALGERGLRQSEAVFQHIRQLPEALKQALDQSGHPPIAAVCASSAPTSREGSYMPVFLAGLSFARGIAQALGAPCYQTSHQQGHFAAAGIGLEALPERHLGFHLSGGTTEIVRIEGEAIEMLGASADISAGQLIDRVGVALGLPFPAGPALEKLACGAVPAGRYPASVKEGIRCSLSGAEAQALRDHASGMPAGIIAAELFDCVARVVLKMGIKAAAAAGLGDLLITGGVASSALLRRLLTDRVRKRGLPLKLHFGQAEYAGDNAAGVAAIGVKKFRQSKEAGDGSHIKR